MSAENKPELVSKRRVNLGAEQYLGMEIPVLDHGFVKLVEYMGDDQSVEEAARISYGGGTRNVNETTGLIRYLRRHRHTTPFEMAELKFHIKIPLVVLAQMIRHRTANINQISARYSLMDNEFYIPERENIGVQSSVNRQGRGEEVEFAKAEEFRTWLILASQEAYGKYEYFLNDDGTGKPVDTDKPMLARELARMGLPQNLYTQLVWKCDLHNIFHFLGLRMEGHAQWEVRQYANAMGQIVKDSFPISYKAFEDYEFNAMNMSVPEQDIIKNLLAERGIVFTEEEIQQTADKLGLTNKRERQDVLDKLKGLGIIKNND